MDDDPTSALDDFFNGTSLMSDSTKLLFIGRPEVYSEFENLGISSMGYQVVHSQTIESAFNHLLQEEFVIVLLDLADPNLDAIKFSNTIRKNNQLTRIVVVTELIELSAFYPIFNFGSIDAILPKPLKLEHVIKNISQQEARYEINKANVSFVSQPPKLSKASFLLLDPSLAFGDENQPLNFVGIMIVSQTVPKYTRWWEETLSQDEYLLAGYLSSITALGDDLFQNQQALKEINFGGISVIFRFHKTLQISFLVRNLTRHNYEKAEERISTLVNQILLDFGEQLASRDFLSEDELRDLDLIVDAFDSQDEFEQKKFDSLQEEKEKKTSQLQEILIYGSDLEKLEQLKNQLHQSKTTLSLDFHDFLVTITSEEDKAVEQIRTANVGILILDSKLGEGVRDASDFADFSREMNYSLKIILLERSNYINSDIIDVVNNDYVDYVYPYETDANMMMKSIQDGLEKSLKIKQQIASGDTSGQDTDSSIVAKMMLRENLDAYEEEAKPELTGIIITKGMDPIFNLFWKEVNFDLSMLSGMVASLKNVGGEMFTQEEKIDALEMADSFIFVRDHANHLFIYFTDNINANTSVIISEEIDQITLLFNEILNEAGDLIPVEQLQPFFQKIASKAHYSFTEILGESKRKKN